MKTVISPMTQDTFSYENAIRLLFLLCFFLPLRGNSSPLETQSATAYVSITSETNSSTPRLVATKSDINGKWFDDYPSVTSRNTYDLGFSLPWWGLTTEYRNRNLKGRHRGAASKRIGFLWVDMSFLSGISSNDTVTYDLQLHEISLGKQFKPGDSTWLVPKFGLNLIDASVTASGGGSSQTKSGLLPLPYIGFAAVQSITESVSAEFDGRYSRLSSSTASISFKETQLAINYSPIKHVQLSLGYSNFRLTAEYKKSFTAIELNVPAKSPFVRLTAFF